MSRSSVVLHPSVREWQQPRMSAAALSEYLILRPDQQDTVLHDSKFSRPPIVGAYGDAIRALRAYNLDPHRSPNALEQVKAALIAKARAATTKPKAQDEALRCIEAIELFERSENAFGTRSMRLVAAPRFELIDIRGVAVSIQPDFLVEAVRVDGSKWIGGVLLRLQKAPDPSACQRQETRERRGEHRREMARYMVELLQTVLEAQAGERGAVDRDLCFVLDVRLGERIGAASNRTARMRAITSACDHIARLWETISPRPSVLRK